MSRRSTARNQKLVFSKIDTRTVVVIDEIFCLCLGIGRIKKVDLHFHATLRQLFCISILEDLFELSAVGFFESLALKLY